MSVIRRLRREAGAAGPPGAPGLIGQWAINLTAADPIMWVTKADGTWVDLLAPEKASIADLQGRMTAAEGTFAGLDARLDAAEADIDTAEANIANLQGRMTAAEGSITNLQGRMTAAEADIDAAQATIISLDGRLDAAEAAITALQAADVALDGRLDAAEASIVALNGKTGQATETVAGIAEIATTAEVNAGADDQRIITPAKLSARLASFVPALPNATETVVGGAELATQTETNAGIDDARIITPAKLRGFNGTIGGQVTIGGGAASASIQSKSTAGSVEFQWDNGARVYKAWMAAGGSAWGLRDVTAGRDRFFVDSVGVLKIPGTGTPANYAFFIVEGDIGAAINVQSTAGTSQPVSLRLINAGRTFSLQTGGDNAFHIYDESSGGKSRLTIDSNGGWTIGERNDGYATLLLNATTQPPILYYKSNVRQWHEGLDATGNYILQDDNAGAIRWYIDTSGNARLVTGSLYVPGGLTGGEGDAGRLKCYNTGNYVTFSWSGTALFARIDNGGAIVQLS